MRHTIKYNSIVLPSMEPTEAEGQVKDRYTLSKPVTNLIQTYLPKKALVTVSIKPGDNIVIDADPETGLIRIYKDTGVRA